MKETEGKGIGLLGAVVTIVGFVVGASIYILPGAIAETAGPGMIASYGIAAILAAFSCIVAAQLGAAFPMKGASVVMIARLVSPIASFICVWMMIGAAVVAIALLGLGFAETVRVWIPGADQTMLAAGLIVGLTVLNLLGVRDTLFVQGLLVVYFIVALGVFAFAGLSAGDWNNLTPFAPNGLQPILAGAIPAFFSFAGFIVILELGGEVRDPARNIPLSLGLSFVTVALIYGLVALTLVVVLPWREMGDVAAPVASAAAMVLAPWLASFVAISALAAIASSVNVLLLGYSRDVLVLARSRVFPRFLSKVSPTTGEPRVAIALIAALSLAVLFIGAGLVEYATFVVVSLMALQIGLGLAALRLPSRDGARYGSTAFRLPRPALWFFAVGLVLLSIAFVGLAILSNQAAALAGFGFVCLGVLFYIARALWLRGQGVSMASAVIGEGDPLSSHPAVSGQATP